MLFVRVCVCVVCVFWGCGSGHFSLHTLLPRFSPPTGKQGSYPGQFVNCTLLGSFSTEVIFLSVLYCAGSFFTAQDMVVLLYHLAYGFFFFLSGVICHKENQQKNSCVTQPNRSAELLVSDSGSKIGL